MRGGGSRLRSGVGLALLLAGFALLPGVALADGWAAEPPAPQVWVASNAVVYLRASPDPRADELALVRANTALRILSDADGWEQVIDPRTRTTGYVRADLLTPADAPSPYIYM